MLRRFKRLHLVVVVVFLFLSWNIFTYYTLVNRNAEKELGNEHELEDRLGELQRRIASQLEENKQLLDQLKTLRHLADVAQSQTRAPDSGKISTRAVVAGGGAGDKVWKELPPQPEASVLPVLMIACDRVTISRSLDMLLKYRPSPERFPIIVSQDCGHEQTAIVIQSYINNKNITHISHIKQPDLRDIVLPFPQKKFVGYYKIARHYKWALSQIFQVLNYSAVIIVEDDLDVAPDFFEYFAATYKLLHMDPVLWCVSAWNDNGKSSLISNEPEKLYRTDFFPGLGWMIERRLWLELEPKWPETFWDDWMRHPQQRMNRECIRPEICRTSTFGKKGVSKGLYFDKHLKFIELNKQVVPFTRMDLTYLQKERYDADFVKTVYGAAVMSAAEVVNGLRPEEKVVRVQYDTKDDFKRSAKLLGIMDDFKAGVPRAAYRGIVSFMFNGRRVFLAPPAGWTGYDITWS